MDITVVGLSVRNLKENRFLCRLALQHQQNLKLQGVLCYKKYTLSNLAVNLRVSRGNYNPNAVSQLRVVCKRHILNLKKVHE
jgi:hypothetical protein